MTRTDALDDRFDEAVRTLLDAHSAGVDVGKWLARLAGAVEGILVLRPAHATEPHQWIRAQTTGPHVYASPAPGANVRFCR